MITRYSLYAIAFILLAVILDSGMSWIVNINKPYVSFKDFFEVMIISLITAWISISIMKFIRTKSLLSMNLEGKEVVNVYGSLIGKVVGINGDKEVVILQSMFGKRITISFDSILSVRDEILVKTYL